MKDKYNDNNELIEDIKQLQNYEGYIQFSDTKIRDCDIFKKDDNISTKIQPTNGFIYEAHFCNSIQSISIKQINDSWYIDETDISNIDNTDIQVYCGENNTKIKMAQIWEKEKDKLCEDIEVKKLKKVVFVGFDSAKKQPTQIHKQHKQIKEEKYTPEQKDMLLEHFLKMFDENYINNILEKEL